VFPAWPQSANIQANNPRAPGDVADNDGEELLAANFYGGHVGLKSQGLTAVVPRLLAIPVKRFEHVAVGYLTREKIQKFFAASIELNGNHSGPQHW